MTNSAGVTGEQASYTAFGERVSGSSVNRFGYVGAFGYQSAGGSLGDPYVSGMPYQHVGARYYDPTTGRFLQRDPLGIRLGLNVYEYAYSRVTSLVDPIGLVGWAPPTLVHRHAKMCGFWVLCSDVSMMRKSSHQIMEDRYGNSV